MGSSERRIIIPPEANKLRKMLLKIELREVQANANVNLAMNDAEFYTRSSNKKEKSKGMKARAEKRLNEIYLENIKKTKKAFFDQLNFVLRGYTDTQKKMWIMAFIYHYDYKQIMEECNYGSRHVERLLEEFRKDLARDTKDDI